MIAIEVRSFVESEEAFEHANQGAARVHTTLTSRLAGTGAMAGDASVAEEFAAAYDDAAEAAVDAIAGLVDAFATCGRLTSAALDNHGRAENRSVISGRMVWTGSSCVSGYVAVLPCSLPSSLGGDSSSLPGWAAWLLDQVEGFVWPDADCDRLREAARTWRSAAHSVADQAHHCGSAVEAFDRLRSPEVPVAVEVTEAMAGRCHTVAEQCEALATACEQYADHVEAQREAILDLVHDLLRDAVIIQGIGILLGAFSVGTTAAGAAALNAARIATAAPRFLKVLTTLRALAASAAAPLRTAATSLRGVHRELAVFRNVRTTLASTYAAERLARVERMRPLMGHPPLIRPDDLRGLSRADVERLCQGWPVRDSSRGSGLVFEDPVRQGRQIRVMDGYPSGTRPDPMTEGPYLVLSQNGLPKVKIPLLGNPVS